MATQPVTVLIVDDSAQLAEMLGEIVADPGRVEVVGTADSVAAANECIARLAPDVVIVDLQLKDGNGFQVAEAIRRLPDGARTDVVFLTNHTSPEFIRRANELGALAFLDKSSDHARVVELVQARAARERS
jgi:DNA-binding NarL/FixJ family response regulator